MPRKGRILPRQKSGRDLPVKKGHLAAKPGEIANQCSFKPQAETFGLVSPPFELTKNRGISIVY